MNALIPIDQKGVNGPASALICNINDYSSEGVEKIANTLKENFINLTHTKPKGKTEFAMFVLDRKNAQVPIQPVEVVRTSFFQNMQSKIPSKYHEEVCLVILPKMLKVVQQTYTFPNMPTEDLNDIEAWYARSLECYLTEEQILTSIKSQQSQSKESHEERMKIGKELYEAASHNKITEKDLDTLVAVTKTALSALEHADHQAKTMEFTAKYLNLFSMEEDDPQKIGKEVTGMLGGVFKQKIFPKPASMKE